MTILAELAALTAGGIAKGIRRIDRATSKERSRFLTGCPSLGNIS
jgi:hypothetical protein